MRIGARIGYSRTQEDDAMIAVPREVHGPEAWTGDRLGGKDAVCFDLREEHLQALDSALQAVRDRGLETTEVERADFALDPIAEDIAGIVRELQHGRGLVVVRGFPVERYSLADLETVYWGFGVHLGVAVSQSVMGDRLGHVIDVTDTDPNARAYRNNRELTLHTDLADIVSFLCVRKAKSGGVSWFASALAVHNMMLETRPDLLAILYRGFPWFRSGEHGSDSAAITPWQVPVLSEAQGLVSCRYVRSYIMEAAEREGEPLSGPEVEALDCFEEIAHRDGVPISFVLEPGEAVLINNLTVMHARTAFRSDEHPERKRLLLRLWMMAHESRPQRPELKIFDGEGEHGIPPQAGRTPSYVSRVPTREISATARSER